MSEITHHRREAPPERRPELLALYPILLRLLHCERTEEMLCSLLVRADVQTGDANVVDGPSVRRPQAQCLAIHTERLLGLGAVREAGAETIPQQIVLLHTTISK